MDLEISLELVDLADFEGDSDFFFNIGVEAVLVAGVGDFFYKNLEGTYVNSDELLWESPEFIDMLSERLIMRV